MHKWIFWQSHCILRKSWSTNYSMTEILARCVGKTASLKIYTENKIHFLKEQTCNEDPLSPLSIHCCRH